MPHAKFRELSDRARRLYRKLTDEPQLAYDIAQAAEVENQGAASALAALERRGLAGRTYDEERRVHLWYRASPPEHTEGYSEDE
jgi:hypothetical protein